MKKLRFLLVGVLTTLTLSVGLFSGLNHKTCVRAEDEITEVAEETETEEEIVEEENEIIDLSQIAKDSIEVIKTICNQPIVVGGISITLGTIVLWAISKIVGSVSSKKTKSKLTELEKKIIELLAFTQDSIKKKDYNALVERYEGLVKALTQIAPTIKNIQVRENLISMLNDFKPILLEDKDFIESEAKEVAQDTKEQLEKNASEILTILNK